MQLYGVGFAHIARFICRTYARLNLYCTSCEGSSVSDTATVLSIVYAGDTECNALFYNGRTGAVQVLVYISSIICRDVKIK